MPADHVHSEPRSERGEPRAGQADPRAEPSLAEIVRQWGRIGCIGFGGPPAHIALLRELCVTRRHWLTEPAVRARDRRHQPAARPGLHAARDLLRVAAARRPRRAARRRLLHRSRARGDPRAVGAVSAGIAARVGARRRPWSRRRGGRRCGAGGPRRGRTDLAARGSPAAPRRRARLRTRRRDRRRRRAGAVARARAARVRRRRAATSERLAAPRRRWHGVARRSALVWTRAEGRRAGLRRRLRDRAADAVGRGQHLPLDDATRSS